MVRDVQARTGPKGKGRGSPEGMADQKVVSFLLLGSQSRHLRLLRSLWQVAGGLPES